VVAQFLFLLVRSEWQLVIPGVVNGIAHGLMFPSVVGAGIRTFPSRYRGVAMTLVQGTWDMGTLIGAPAAGLIVEYSYLVGLPAYPTLFMTVAAMMTTVGVLYAASRPRPEPPEDDWPTPGERRAKRQAAGCPPVEPATPAGRQCV
jgi:MFS family permease